jgi:ubiquinone/menaquinone biosynthesis C-methylase UbiE
MNPEENQNSLLPQDIERYYGQGLEAGRLDSPAGQLEFVRTQDILRRYIPSPPAIVLDVGGGPGAYACWLARQGYTVHLIDPMPLHLEQAQQASQEQPETPLQSITLGDARDLQHPDGSADVVLLLGPLYHLTQRADRMTALREALRVLKPGGVLLAVAISRFASTFQGLVDDYFYKYQGFMRIAHQDLLDGQHRNPSHTPHYFTTAFFHHPDQLQDELQEAGFRVENLLAVEGAAVFLQDLPQRWSDPVHRKQLLETVGWLEDEPSLLGATGHLAAIGIKSNQQEIRSQA